MLFSSVIFIYIFLPTVLFAYYVLFRKSRNCQNVFLLISSLFFYAWGEPKFVFVMILSIVLNYFFGIWVNKSKQADNRFKSKVILTISILFNLSILFVFKYLNFVADNISVLTGSANSIPEIALPIGISFFTFQSMSYVFDVYYGKADVQRNILYVGLYISFFPQLIAGPIVRYETIAEEIENRQENISDFTKGLERFIIGLAKKVLIANSVAVVADMAFDTVAQGSTISVAMAWLGAICYTFQIYYDFSGYSDMAIGLGMMFGFHFLENFNYPYISTSITEFWRRWHISLGSWFRDYVYFPLGGSRESNMITIRNLFVVWLLTGIWHGANWTFILWGLMYFVLISIEKITGFAKRNLFSIFKPISCIYALFFVIMGWILFRSESISVAGDYYQNIFGCSDVGIFDGLFFTELKSVRIHIFVAALFSFPVLPWIKSKLKGSLLLDIVSVLLLLMLFILSVASIVGSSYNPFIYFNF